MSLNALPPVDTSCLASSTREGCLKNRQSAAPMRIYRDLFNFAMATHGQNNLPMACVAQPEEDGGSLERVFFNMEG